jgi:hypothetical protein
MLEQLLSSSSAFVEGAAGTGKTSTGIHYLRALIERGVSGESVLVLVPQRTLGRPYQLAMTAPDWPRKAPVDIVTLGGLARRSIEIFWPDIAEEAGFESPLEREPRFLTIETAQYYMANFIDPAIEAGQFDSINVPRARLIAQSLDNLSKAATNNFTIPEVAERLRLAWGGHTSRYMIYQAWLDVAQIFREHCLQHCLLDFSLQIQVFMRHLLGRPFFQEYIQNVYRNMIADNLEENFPVTLDFIRENWKWFDTALLLYDTEAGYRIFLGAAPDKAYELRDLCEVQVNSTMPYVQSLPLQTLSSAIDDLFIEEEISAELPDADADSSPIHAFSYGFHNFYPQMLDWVADEVIYLVTVEDVEPKEIVLLAPYLSDSLRFSIFNRLENEGIPVVSHRPSRAIRDEPSARALLTLMALANPAEQEHLPPTADLTDTLVQVIDGLDPVRARLLTEIIYSVGRWELSSFAEINHVMQSRITYVAGERYERLRNWLFEQRETTDEIPPDHFLRSLFGDLLSQPGYGFHTDLDAGDAAAQLVESALRFRQTLYPDGYDNWSVIWQQYRQLVNEGLLAALHPESWHKEEQNAVFIAPAYTYLMRNRPVDYQFWMDVGNTAWAERLDQPLTHPYVLRRGYPRDHVWSDEDEVAVQWEMLHKLVLGLTRRCRQHIYLAIADLGEQGFEQRGPLLRIFQHILQRYRPGEES